MKQPVIICKDIYMIGGAISHTHTIAVFTSSTLGDLILIDSGAGESFDVVEGKQTIHGLRSGTDWEIDAKGIREGANEGFIIIAVCPECLSKD